MTLPHPAMFGERPPTLYYEPSGKTPIDGLCIFGIGGLLAIWILGIIYTFVLEFIPFIYVSFVGTICFGVGSGFSLNKLSKFAHLRSPVKVTILASLMAIIGYWLHWAFFCAFYLARNADDVNLISAYLAFQAKPPVMIAFAADILDNGHFTIGKGTGLPVSGMFLGLLWIVEAFIVIGGTVWFSRKQSRLPYSEARGRWAVAEVLPARLASFAAQYGVKGELEAGNLALLLNAEQSADDADIFATLTLYTVEDDPDCQFLTLTDVEIVVNAKGKVDRKETIVVEHLRVTVEHCQALRARFGVSQPSGTV